MWLSCKLLLGTKILIAKLAYSVLLKLPAPMDFAAAQTMAILATVNALIHKLIIITVDNVVKL